ncbi:SLC13 family permease [Deinococcus radiophilus]|uniref:SLC13 family permease n=1 Tax=Deinococcus radiophilus TaxID=32062 RepID=UPI00360DA2BD
MTSNTATTAVFLPVMYALSRRTGEHVGRVMMPLAFASILGGSITLIGTSTNLVVSGFLPQLGLEPLGFFELAWVGSRWRWPGCCTSFSWRPGCCRPANPKWSSRCAPTSPI